MISQLLAKIFGRMQYAYFKDRYDKFRKKYRLPEDFRFNGYEIKFYGEGSIIVGLNSYIGSYSTIQAKVGQKVVIGTNCQISHNVRIYTSSSDPDQDFTVEKEKPPITGDVIIGNGVWIGANVFINPGICIGDNTVIGANSVVTKDIPPNVVAAGAPARVIREKQIQ